MVLSGEAFRSRLGRRTSRGGGVIAEIDGLRFPAIAIVVLGHLSSFFIQRPGAPGVASAPDRMFQRFEFQASEGVVLFFIISGFVLALPFARAHLFGEARPGMRGYYLRRVTRLEPPYLISLFAFLLLKLVARSFNMVDGQEGAGLLVRHFAASAFYLHNLIYGTPSLINGVAWSLEIEIQFYLIVPLLTQVFRIRSTLVRRGVLLAAIVGSVVAQHVLAAGPGRFALSIGSAIQFFLTGFLLADIYLVDGLGGAPREWRWDVVALAAWIACLVLWTGEHPYPAAIPFVGLVAFIAVFRGRLTNRLFTNPWITTFGGMCYSIYLLHFTVLATTGKVLGRWLTTTGAIWSDVLVQGPLLLAVAVVASIIFFALIELPCMDKQWPARLKATVRSWIRPAVAS